MMSKEAGRPFVVVVARGVPDERSPLLGRFEFDQALALQAAGAQVVVAALDCRSVRRWRPGLARPGRVQRLTFDGLPVLRLDVGLGNLPSAIFIPALAAAWRRLYQAISSDYGRPEVVHAHFTRWAAGVVQGMARRQDRPLVVMTEHSSNLRPSNMSGPAMSAQDRRLGRVAYRADRVLAVSSALASVLADEFSVSATVVPDVIDVSAFASAALDPERPDGEVRLVSVGNLIARKGMGRLVSAFATAFPHSGVRLTIVGQGEQRQALATQISEAGLDERVRLVGGLSRAGVADLFADSDGFCLFSDYETFGVVYVEAMAAGLPVLATRCGGPADFITPDVGMFTGRSLEDDVAALKSFVKQLPTFDPQVIAAVAAVKYSPAAIADQLLEIYGSSGVTAVGGIAREL